ncbi:unnamed protein product [Ostreobium quekettii]|uniref:Prefoldin subunit 3 n=1 Tax=Ostreobium quekettii TaxID=121088 RepID=A0A8S1ITG9_9CHLO|nr:unnamed protein product [Ostreobium quekettii]|eukprot:evm.model.scf_84.12 EVM.evm.TU.scf_84.12   scf_84:142456-144947(-)
MSSEGGADPNPVLPKAQFIEDVGEYLKGRSADDAIAGLNEHYRRYKLEESRLLQRRVYNLSKLPEVKKTLDIVNLLIQKEGGDSEVTVDFELADNVFAKATFQDVHTVNLWLGAGVMVEYPLLEAKGVLEGSLTNCKANLETIKQDLEKIKDYITITEVSIARIYNHDVERRRLEGGSSSRENAGQE